MTIQDKLKQIRRYNEISRRASDISERLTAEVEAEVSRMGGVGAAPETKKTNKTEKILTRFNKTIKR